MITRNTIVKANTLLQWSLLTCINLIFVFKYAPRMDWNPIVCSIIYTILVIGLAIFYQRFIVPRMSEHTARNISIAIIIGFVFLIALAIIFIPPLSIRVDRWSATSYFLDALFQGDYPYGVLTHTNNNNFPSPFPLWHYLHIPFWLIGDVGWQNVFFFLLFICSVYYYFRSWRITLFVLILLMMSPAYWWELLTRSDGVSNILLAFFCILFIQRKQIEMDSKWWLLAIISGCIASTRLTAVIPFALFLFRPWWDTDWRKKIGFIGIAIAVVILFFLPYVFWDTTNWIFFERNPFITQTLQGNKWIFLVMVIIAIAIAYNKQSFYYYVSTTSAFLFTFMLVSLLCRMWIYQASLFSPYCDISYLTLSLPFAIIALADNKYE